MTLKSNTYSDMRKHTLNNIIINGFYKKIKSVLKDGVGVTGVVIKQNVQLIFIKLSCQYYFLLFVLCFIIKNDFGTVEIKKLGLKFEAFALTLNVY